MHTWQKWATGAVALVLAGSVLNDDQPSGAPEAAAPASARATPTTGPESPSATSSAPAATQPSPTPPVSPTDGVATGGASSPTAGSAGRGELLRAASGGDGDSWRDAAGREYRLGLVDTPEVGDCYGAQATAERRRLVADGFRADVYETDRYGRAVAAVTTADGRDLNVHLARQGFADDRYLAQFRSENPGLAARLKPAFAAARQERKGLWGACRTGAEQDAAPPAPAAAATPVAAAPAADGCHPDYVTCVPVKGDGSGQGQANDLDCGDLPTRVQLRQVGVDPYRLDADGDGQGCDSSPPA